jgi:succinyl-diaminopimelate desuccinylase
LDKPSLAEIYNLINKELDEHEIIDFHRSFVKIPSVNPSFTPPGEENAAQFLAEKMKEFGLKVEVDEYLPKRPNVYGKIEGKKGNRTLIFNSHMDVMPVGDVKNWKMDPFSGDIIEGRIYGRGACDAKGPLAAMVMAAKVLNDIGVELSGSLLVTAVSDEEVAQKGTLRMAEKGMRGNFAVVGEPTGLNIGIAEKGNAYYEITVAGKSAHAAVPEVGINAIYKMAKIINEIEKHHFEIKTRKHQLLGCPSINVGTITGGDAPNAVPEKCTINVDRRYIPGESGETAKKELEQIIEVLKQRDPELKVEIKKTVDAEALETSEEEPIVKSLKDAGRMVTGQSTRTLGFPYASDGWILSNRLNVPTVLFGPGNIDKAHKPNEFVEIKELINATKICALTAFALLR